MGLREIPAVPGLGSLLSLGLEGRANGVGAADSVARTNGYLSGGAMATVNMILAVLYVANDTLNVSATVFALVVFVHFDPP